MCRVYRGLGCRGQALDLGIRVEGLGVAGFKGLGGLGFKRFKV